MKQYNRFTINFLSCNLKNIVGIFAYNLLKIISVREEHWLSIKIGVV